MSSPRSITPLALIPNTHQMDDLLHLLGFQDLQDAQDWVLKHGQGRVVPLSPPPQADHQALVHHSHLAKLQPDPHYLLQELDRTKQKNLQLTSTLAVAQSRIAALEQERLSQLAYQARHSNPPTHQAISSNPDTSKTGAFGHPTSSSNAPLHALQSINQHLQSQNDTLVKTLADEREKMDQERKGWRTFKRRYAARLVPQGTTQRKTILAPHASPQHNLNPLGPSSAVPPLSHKRQNDENVPSGSTPLAVNIKLSNTRRGPLSPKNDQVSNQSIQPLTPIFPDLNASNNVLGTELHHGASSRVSSDADSSKAQVNQSISRSDPGLLAVASSVEKSARNLSINLDAQIHKQAVTCEQPNTGQQASCAEGLTSTRCAVESSPKADHRCSSAAEHGCPDPVSAACAATPADAPHNEVSQKRRDVLPEHPPMLQSVTNDVRPASDPTQASGGKVDVISQASHLDCDRRPRSPPRQRSSSHSPPTTSPRPRLPLSHRVKLNQNSKSSQRKHTTPRTVPRSKSTLARAETTRSALPSPKWIRYSDRKSRMGNLIWKDSEDEEEGGKSGRKEKGKGKAKPESGQGQFNDAFKADDQRAAEFDEAAKQAEGAPKKPVQMDRVADTIGSQPNDEELEELSTTEDESSRDDVFGPLTRLSSPRPSKAGGTKSDRDVSQTEDVSKKLSGAGDRRTQTSDTCPGENCQSTPSEEFPGQKFMRMVHKKRKEGVEESRKKRKRAAGGEGDLQGRLEIDPERNFGVGHVFDEVARGKSVRKQMRGKDCDCCAGYYEQASKDFSKMSTRSGRHTDQVAQRHQNEISRHRHFNPPPLTPPHYWQMGFPDTQQVEKINEQAKENERIKVARLEEEAKKGIGPYRIKNHRSE